MGKEIKSIEKSLKMGTSFKCSNKTHRVCSVTKEMAYLRKISKKSTRRKLRKKANKLARNSLYKEEQYE